MKAQKTLIIAALAACFACPASAEERGAIGLSATYGTDGGSVFVALPLSDNVHARLGFTADSDTKDISTSESDYDRYYYYSDPFEQKYRIRTKRNAFNALLDWYPDDSGYFRVTGGILYNNDTIDIRAQTISSGYGGWYSLGGTPYYTSEIGNVEGKVKFNKVAPYLGIGLGKGPKIKGWMFTADLGVYFRGSPSVTLNNQKCEITLPGYSCAQLAEDLKREREDLKDELGYFGGFIRMGASYNF